MPCSRRVRIAVAILYFLFLASSPSHGGSPSQEPAPVVQWQTFRKTVQPFFAKHCLHAMRTRNAAGFAWTCSRTSVPWQKDCRPSRRSWTCFASTPCLPKNVPSPGHDEVKPVLAWLDAFVARAIGQTRGRIRPCRHSALNRTEYNNTVRDLSGSDVPAGEDFPPDVPGHGFDTSAGTLSVSPVLVEKYLTAAEKVARTALFGAEPMKPDAWPISPGSPPTPSRKTRRSSSITTNPA